MILGVLYFLALLFLVIFAVAEIFVFQKNKKDKENLEKQIDDAKYKIYEIKVLNDLNDKIGYSLGAENIIEIITRYVSEITDYSALCSILPLPKKIVFRAELKDSVSSEFVEDIKQKMLARISSLVGENLTGLPFDDKITGAILSEDSGLMFPKSFFDVPLVISGKIVGLIFLAHKNPNFYKSKDIVALNKIAVSAGNAITRLEEVVENENSKMNAMVASMTDGVVMTDLNYKILVANPVIKKALGIENKKDFSIVDFSSGLKEKIDLEDKIEESIRLEKVFISDEISIKEEFFKIIVSPVKDKNNWKTLGSVVVFRNITKEKEIEKIKADFTSMIVHELRSPLDSIKKMIEAMRSAKTEKTNQQQYLQLIYSSSSEMLELVNNLLDISKIEAGKFEIDKKPNSIKEIVKSRIMFFDIATKDAKIKLSEKFAEDLPEKVEFDLHMVSEILNNLISNAIKFNIENGFIEIQVLNYKKGESLQKLAEKFGIKWFVKKEVLDIQDSLIVAVTNSGQGIAQDQIGKLFNKFFQAKSVFAKKAGTGLGLAITKSIVESHGGIVGAESVEGKGATFYFTLPI
jgi:signal transduction histidine kinase